jgi:predicted DNA-binding transcriptional regulator AlpA
MGNPQLIFVRQRDVMRQTALTESTLYRRIQDGLFMKPLPISQRCVGWIAEQVSAYNALIARGASDDEIRAFVASVACPAHRPRPPKPPPLARLRPRIQRVRL